MGTVDGDLAYLKKEALAKEPWLGSDILGCSRLQNIYAHLGKVIDRVVVRDSGGKNDAPAI